jgi:hypothetical protein
MFSVIVSIKDESKFNSILLPSLEPVKKFLFNKGCPELQIVKVGGEVSICKNYNQGIKECIYKTKIFVHEDIDLMDNSPFCPLFDRIDNFFKIFPNTGLIGLVGTTENPPGFWWNCSRSSIVGHVICNNEYWKWDVKESQYSVNVVDGMFLATSTDIKFSEDIEGFHFYDSDYSNKIKQAGYDVKVLVHLVNHRATSKDISKISNEYYNKKWGLK